MKKLIAAALIAAVAAPAFAQDAQANDEADSTVRAERRTTTGSDPWPAFFAICEYPAASDVAGLRITIPFSTRQTNITGVDLGLWGRAYYFEGFQVNILRNDVRDWLSGFQVGIYNTIGSGDLLGLQVGLWNEANSMQGVQAGLVNISGETEGFQIGIVNRCDTMHGYQFGLINIIREAELRFFPIVNIGF